MFNLMDFINHILIAFSNQILREGKLDNKTGSILNIDVKWKFVK